MQKLLFLLKCYVNSIFSNLKKQNIKIAIGSFETIPQTLRRNTLSIFASILFLTPSIFHIEALNYKNLVSNPALPIKTSVVVDANSGRILYSHNAHVQIYPASLTKVMTVYLTFAAIEDGKLSMSDYIKVSKKAADMKPSKIGLKAGSQVMVRDAINAVIIKSANDMAVALAEAVSGNQENFVKKMNIYARKMGMHSTHFTNSSGWHDVKQKTTSIDMAKLALAIKRDFPERYKLFSQTSFKLNNQTYVSKNNITRYYPGAKGLKTGFHTPSGFNIMSSASFGNKDVVAVVSGGCSIAERDIRMVKLLDCYLGRKNSLQHKNFSYTKVSNKKKVVKSKRPKNSLKTKLAVNRHSKKNIVKKQMKRKI